MFWSVNPWWTADFKAIPSHETTRGVKPFSVTFTPTSWPTGVASSGAEMLRLQGHTDSVTCVCFSPDGQRLASASVIRRCSSVAGIVSEAESPGPFHTQKPSGACCPVWPRAAGCA